MIVGEKKMYLRREFKLVDIDPEKRFVVARQTKFGSPDVKIPYFIWENPPAARIIIKLEIVDQMESGMAINALKEIPESVQLLNGQTMLELVEMMVDQLKKESMPIFTKIFNGEPIQPTPLPPPNGNGNG